MNINTDYLTCLTNFDFELAQAMDYIYDPTPTLSPTVSVTTGYYQISGEVCEATSDIAFDNYLMPCAKFTSDDVDFGDCITDDSTISSLLATIPSWTYHSTGDYGE